jgi:hypothetical protein
VEPHEVVVREAPRLGIPRIHPRDPVVVAVDQDAVLLDVVDERVLAVGVRMEAVARMRRDELGGSA